MWSILKVLLRVLLSCMLHSAAHMLILGILAAAEPSARRRKRTWLISSLAISVAMRCEQENCHEPHVSVRHPFGRCACMCKLVCCSSSIFGDTTCSGLGVACAVGWHIRRLSPVALLFGHPNGFRTARWDSRVCSW